MGLLRERAKMELIRERAYQRWDLQEKGLIRDGAYKGEDLPEMGLIRERAYQRWGL